MDDFKSKVIQGFAWETSTRIIVQAASWISTIWVARILAPSDYGIVGVSGIFTGLCLMMAGMGLGSALVSRQEISKRDASNIFWIGNCLGVSFYLILAALAPLIARFFEMPDLKEVIWVAGVMILLSSLGIVPRAMLSRQMNFRVSALVRMVGTLIVTISAVVFARAGFGYWALIFSAVLGELVQMAIFFGVVRFFPSWPKDLGSSKPMLVYGGNLVGAGVVGYMNRQWASIYSGQFLGPVGTGYYQMANTLAGMPMTKIGEIFTQIAFPSFANIQSEPLRVKSVFLRLHRILFLVTVPLFFGLAILAPDLVGLLIGEKWLDIVVALQIMCVLNVFRISAQIIPPLLAGVGNAKATRNYELILLPILAIGMLIGVQWGLESMLIAWALGYPLAYYYLLSILKRTLAISVLDVVRTMVPALVSGAFMIGVVLYARSLPIEMGSQILNLALQVAVGAVVYVAVYVTVDRATVKELIELLSSRRKVKARVS